MRDRFYNTVPYVVLITGGMLFVSFSEMEFEETETTPHLRDPVMDVVIPHAMLLGCWPEEKLQIYLVQEINEAANEYAAINDLSRMEVNEKLVLETADLFGRLRADGMQDFCWSHYSFYANAAGVWR